jgi:hypothetical protein
MLVIFIIIFPLPALPSAQAYNRRETLSTAKTQNESDFIQ